MIGISPLLQYLFSVCMKRPSSTHVKIHNPHAYSENCVGNGKLQTNNIKKI